jgi:hypothetical protein
MAKNHPEAAESANPSSPELAGSSTPPQAEVPVTTASIVLACAAKAIADNGGKREWTQAVHNRAIVHAAIYCGMDRALGKLLLGLLEHKGLGGNASQHRQWLEATGDKGPGLVDPAAKAISTAADF